MFTKQCDLPPAYAKGRLSIHIQSVLNAIVGGSSIRFYVYAHDLAEVWKTGLMSVLTVFEDKPVSVMAVIAFEEEEEDGSFSLF